MLEECHILAIKSSSITTYEFEEKVNADWDVYWKYFTLNGTWLPILISIFILIFYPWSGIQTNRYIEVLIENIDEEGSFRKYFWIIAFYDLVFGVSITLSFFIIMMTLLRLFNKLHQNMTERTLRATINLYFDKTPTGKILSRFSKDINKLDTEMPFTVIFLIECLTWVGQLCLLPLWSSLGSSLLFIS